MQIKDVKFLKGDFLIIIFIILIAVIIFFISLPKVYNENILQVYLDSKLLHSFKLDSETEKIIEIDNIVHNTIEIKGEKVRVINSTCYDHICENVGYISKSGELIVCMPNRLLVKIIGENKAELDAVVR